MLGSYLARIGSTVLQTRSADRLGLLDEVRLPLRIWPSDIDIYLHVNNGRYLTLMDQGRLAHTRRTGLLEVMLKRRWMPVLAAAAIEFRRELRALQRAELVTSLYAWDAKWFWFEHRFERDAEVYARALVRGVVKHQGRTVPTAQLFGALGPTVASPRPPPALDLPA